MNSGIFTKSIINLEITLGVNFRPSWSTSFFTRTDTVEWAIFNIGIPFKAEFLPKINEDLMIRFEMLLHFFYLLV